MAAILLKVSGTLLQVGERSALLLQAGQTTQVLRLGFILRGVEHVILPESLLDDWGHEMATSALFTWVRENGLHFPRAEVFGFDPNGRARQCFLREVDLFAGYACYCFESATTPISHGRKLNAILLPAPGSNQRQRLSSPMGVDFPLSEANVQWWQIPEETVLNLVDLSFLD